jgi:hypothetical protein
MEDHVVKMKRWFTFATILATILQFIHVPLRVAHWYQTNPVENHSFVITPTNSWITYSLIFVSELGGIVNRNFALVIIIYIGIQLIELYHKICRIHSNKEVKGCFSHKTSQSDFMKFMMDPERLADSDLGESKGLTMPMMEQFLRLKVSFDQFNQILGSYALTILLWAIGNLTMEVIALSTTTTYDLESSTINNFAGAFGTVFGLIVIYLVTLLGHHMEHAV